MITFVVMIYSEIQKIWILKDMVCVCVLAVYNKAQPQRISNPEFKLWTFLAETCVMSHQSLSRQAKSKYESPTAVEFGCKTPKSDHGSSENV